MKQDNKFVIDHNGKAIHYDDTYDIIIHCESEKEQGEVTDRLRYSISVKEIEAAEREIYKIVKSIPVTLSKAAADDMLIKDIGDIIAKLKRQQAGGKDE
jgi:hypothetical protein